MSVEITADSGVCEKVWCPTFGDGVWACMLDEGHAADACILTARRDREDRRREVLRDRDQVALRAEVERLRA